MGCNALCNIERMTQVVARIPQDLADEVDRLVDDGVIESRSEAVRQGLLGLVERHRRSVVGEAIVDGYRRTPQDDSDSLWSDRATIEMIAQEPW